MSAETVDRAGTHVVYTLAEHDVSAINQRRAQHQHESGNPVSVGQRCPAFIVRDWGGSVNLKVLLDGHGDHWATSAAQGDGEGQWQPASGPRQHGPGYGHAQNVAS